MELRRIVDPPVVAIQQDIHRGARKNTTYHSPPEKPTVAPRFIGPYDLWIELLVGFAGQWMLKMWACRTRLTSQMRHKKTDALTRQEAVLRR